MRLAALLGCWILAVFCGLGPAAADSRDGAAGEIDGQGALAVLPRDGVYGESCRAHVAFEDEPESEAILRCGEYALPPAYGRMVRAWIEEGDAMSPYVERFVPRVEAPGSVTLVAPPAPAGRVILAGLDAGPGIALRLLDADPLPLRAGRLPPENLRSLSGDRWQEGALMPAGEAVAWLWDADAREIVALSRPFAVVAGAAVTPSLRMPGSGSELLAELIRDPDSIGEQDQEVAVELMLDGKPRKPDLIVPTPFKVYAFFFDLGSGPAELAAQTSSSLLPLQRLGLESGKIQRISAKLLRRPELEVELLLPTVLQQIPATLEIVRLAGAKILESRLLSRSGRRQYFEGMPADLLEVRLVTRLGSAGERVDMSGALDASVRLEPRLAVRFGLAAFPVLVLETRSPVQAVD